MAKTIHDLAVAYGKEHQGTVDIEVFEAGANAVLEKVEEILNQKESKIGKLGRIALLDLLVHELKGE